VSENSPIYDELEDALLGGDAAEVREVVRRKLAGMRTEKERAERLRQLRMSALGRQPLRPGGRQGRDDQAAFLAWARRRLGSDNVRRMLDVQRRYFQTGRRAGLFTADNVERYTQP
jgi:hypothetical protein